MIYLLLSICCATFLVVCFRIFDKWNINSTHAIVYNYLVCVITGLFFVDDFSFIKDIPSWNGLPFAIVLGTMFYLVFIMVGKNTLDSGIVSTSLAMKLSFVIPVVIAIFLYGDSITTYKIAGIIFAIVSVYLVTSEDNTDLNNTDSQVLNEPFVSKRVSKKTRNAFLLPVLIFLGCGLCDSMFNYIQRTKTPEGWDHYVTILSFSVAVITAWAANFYKKELYQWKNVAAGIIMGVPNYFSLYFLLMTLKHLPLQPSVIFPINNLGIVCLSAFVGFVLFRETFNRRKLAGFILAVVSIAIIGFVKK